MGFRGAVVLASVVALSAVSADAGSQTSSPRNGRIVFAVGGGQVEELAVADVRSGARPAFRTPGRTRRRAPPRRGRAFLRDRLEQRHIVSVGTGRPPRQQAQPPRGRTRLRPCVVSVSRRLAFVGVRSGETDGRLRVVNRDGSAFAEIYAGRTRSLRWSPDGAWIAFVVGVGSPVPAGLYAIHPDGSGLHLLAGNNFFGQHDLSPDGRRVVFVRLTNLYTVPSDGGQETRLTNETRERNTVPAGLPMAPSSPSIPST